MNFFYKRPSLINAPLITKSFKSCGLNLKNDGSEDGMIHCFKKEQPCESGSGILKEQFEILKGADRLDQNPFDFERANRLRCGRGERSMSYH